MKIKYLVFIIYLFTSCSGTIGMKSKVVEVKDYAFNSLMFEVNFEGKKIANSDFNISTSKYIDTSMSRDTFVDISFQRWIFRIRKNYINKEGLNKIMYDNRIFNNSVKKELVNESLSFARKHFILDTGEDDIYLLPVIKQ